MHRRARRRSAGRGESAAAPRASRRSATTSSGTRPVSAKRSDGSSCSRASVPVQRRWQTPSGCWPRVPAECCAPGTGFGHSFAGEQPSDSNLRRRRAWNAPAESCVRRWTRCASKPPRLGLANGRRPGRARRCSGEHDGRVRHLARRGRPVGARRARAGVRRDRRRRRFRLHRRGPARDPGGSEPRLKPDWSPDRLLAYPYTGRLAVFRRETLDEAGGIRPELALACDHDVALRVSERARRAVHVTEVLYHRRLPDSEIVPEPHRRTPSEPLPSTSSDSDSLRRRSPIRRSRACSGFVRPRRHSRRCRS